MLLNYILALILAILIALFAVYNGAPVKIDFLLWKSEVSLALVILFAALLGGVFAGLIAIIEQVKMKWKLFKTEQKKRELEIAVKDYENHIQHLENKLNERGIM